MARKITALPSVIIIDGQEQMWDELPQAQREECWGRMMDRASETLSRYYARHPDEAAQFFKA